MSTGWCHGEKGGSRLKALKALFVLAILAAMAFAAVKIVPAYEVNHQLQDSMQEEATLASVNRKNADQIKADVEKTVKDMGIAVDDKSIQVSAYSGNVTISLEYTVSVDLTVYQLRLHFHPQAYTAAI